MKSREVMGLFVETRDDKEALADMRERIRPLFKPQIVKADRLGGSSAE